MTYHFNLKFKEMTKEHSTRECSIFMTKISFRIRIISVSVPKEKAPG